VGEYGSRSEDSRLPSRVVINGEYWIGLSSTSRYRLRVVNCKLSELSAGPPLGPLPLPSAPEHF
jgi:hypothetical protein